MFVGYFSFFLSIDHTELSILVLFFCFLTTKCLNYILFYDNKVKSRKTHLINFFSSPGSKIRCRKKSSYSEQVDSQWEENVGKRKRSLHKRRKEKTKAPCILFYKYISNADQLMIYGNRLFMGLLFEVLFLV